MVSSCAIQPHLPPSLSLIYATHRSHPCIPNSPTSRTRKKRLKLTIARDASSHRRICSFHSVERVCLNCSRPMLVGELSLTDQLSLGHLRQGKFEHPCWGDKIIKHNLSLPNFGHKHTELPFKRNNPKTPKTVKVAIGKKIPRTIASFQNGSSSYGAGRAGNAVHNRWPQLNEVKKIHSHMMKGGKTLQLLEANILMDMYVKCGSIVDAHQVFNNMPRRDVVSWNVMILGYAKQEAGARALELYAQMHKAGVQPCARTLVSALKACNSLVAREEGKHVNGIVVKIVCLEKCRTIHSQVLRTGFDFDSFVGTTLVDLYSKCGSMEDARHVFDKIAHRNVVPWTAMIMGYAKREEGEVALGLYAQMHQEGVIPDQRIFVGVLKACSSLAALEEGKQVDGKLLKVGCLERGRAIYSQLLKSGFESDIFVGTTLVDMYTKCGSIDDAWHAFDKLPHRDVVSWTAMILGYAEKEEGEVALELYAGMQREGVIPDARSFLGALKACSSLTESEEGKHIDGKLVKIGCLQKGRVIHSQVVKQGFESDVFVATTLVDMYAKCGSMEDAQHVFDKLPRCDAISSTAMIMGYAEKEEGDVALKFYTRIQQEDVMPVPRTFVGALKACSSLAGMEEGEQVDGTLVKIECLEKGRAINSDLVKSGYESDVFVGTTLVDMYTKCGSMEDARHVFDKLPHRDVVSWNTMIWGYAEQENSEEAFQLYAEMQEQGLTANRVTFLNTLKACANTAALVVGKELHDQICRVGLDASSVVANTLVNMYAKCGSMADAQQLFDALPTRDVVTWNALIAGYARQGESGLVFHLFDKMRQEGIQPDGVSFLSVLTVCSHEGLVDRGRIYFQTMCKQSGIIPTIEHYNCIVDLIGRAGQVEEAVEILEKMPLQPNFVAWLSVLGSCQKWKNMKVGRYAFEYAVRLNEKHPAAYIMMSNMYAQAEMWEDLNKIQAMRNNVQAWYMPGRSDTDGMVNNFVLGDMRDPQNSSSK